MFQRTKRGKNVKQIEQEKYLTGSLSLVQIIEVVISKDRVARFMNLNIFIRRRHGIYWNCGIHNFSAFF